VYLDPTFTHYHTNGSKLRGKIGLVLEKTWDRRNYGEGYWYRVLVISDIMYFEEYELIKFGTGITSSELRGTI
jgi:hypothetical protein